MSDGPRRPIQAHASVGGVPGGRTSWLYERAAKLNGMHGRRVPVSPPRPVLLHLLWGEKTPALLHAWRFDRFRGWLAEVSALVQASDVEPDARSSRAD